MTKTVKLAGRAGPGNNTVKLPDPLRRRVERAMALDGFTVWSEFCRVALTEKCHEAEERRRVRAAKESERSSHTPAREGRPPGAT